MASLFGCYVEAALLYRFFPQLWLLPPVDPARQGSTRFGQDEYTNTTTHTQTVYTPTHTHTRAHTHPHTHTHTHTPTPTHTGSIHDPMHIFAVACGGDCGC